MKKKREPAFLDAKGMNPGDIISYDPSREGTGEKKEGIIKEISRSFLSLVLEDGTAIGVTRVYTCSPPMGRLSLRSVPRQPRVRPWFIRSDEDDEPPKKYISIPF